ncbi:MAG TPA: hypothetical protein VF800_06915 [Telluria sp.]|jgi:hypothetical protein
MSEMYAHSHLFACAAKQFSYVPLVFEDPQMKIYKNSRLLFSEVLTIDPKDWFDWNLMWQAIFVSSRFLALRMLVTMVLGAAVAAVRQFEN